MCVARVYDCDYVLVNFGYSGDALSPHKDWPFSTKDVERNWCSVRFHGAWWYFGCYQSNLNGRYYQEGDKSNFTGVIWITWKAQSLKTVTMKIRSATFPGQRSHLSTLKFWK